MTDQQSDQPERTSQQQRLIDVGMELFERIAPGLEFSVRLLPEDDAVVVYRAVRGGGSIYVAPDESVLFASSAAPPHEALKAFREGRRTPKEQFVYRPQADGR